MPSWESILHGHQYWSSPKGSVPSCRSVPGARALLVLPCRKMRVPQAPVPAACQCQRKLLSAWQWHQPSAGILLGEAEAPRPGSARKGLGTHQKLPFVTQLHVSSMERRVLVLCF